MREMYLKEEQQEMKVKLLVRAPAVGAGGSQRDSAGGLPYRVPSSLRGGRRQAAMANTRYADLVDKFLEWAFEGKDVRGQDILYAVAGLGRSEVGRVRAWNYVKSHWPSIQERFGSTERFLSLISTLPLKTFASNEVADDVEAVRAAAAAAGPRRPQPTRPLLRAPVLQGEPGGGGHHGAGADGGGHSHARRLARARRRGHARLARLSPVGRPRCAALQRDTPAAASAAPPHALSSLPPPCWPASRPVLRLAPRPMPQLRAAWRLPGAKK